MTNLLQRGATMLAGHLKNSAVAGRAVSYQQGARKITGLYAALSMHEHEVLSTTGDFLTKAMFCDWIFTTADLGTLEPRDGDEITDTATGEKFTVVPMGDKPSVERNDSSGLMTTVHSVRVK